MELGDSKLCQKLCGYPPTLTDATDAQTQHFQRLPTPTDATESLPKQVHSASLTGPPVRTTITPMSSGFTWSLSAGKAPPSADDLQSHSVRYSVSKAPWSGLPTITTPSTKTRSQGI